MHSPYFFICKGVDMANDIQESINGAIDIIVNRRIDALALDKTVIGIIDSVVNSTQGIYKIKYDGGYFNAEAQQNDAIYPKGMSVYVQIPQNDMTKKKLILGRASNLRNSEQADVVISGLNDYSIIGNSVIEPKNESVGEGLRSYHDEQHETDEHPITHRAKLLYSNIENSNNHYSIRLDNFDLYKENATALMVEAEFRTSLDSAQRYSSNKVYGIGLNLSFENSNYQYGQTQSEVFNYFSKDIFATVETSDNTTEEWSMQKIDEKIQESLDSSTYINLIKDDGILDKYISYSNSIINAYAIAAPALFIKEADDIMMTYINMLSDLKNTTISLDDIKFQYNAWKETVIGQNENKQVSYVLNSDIMTGNPFTFTSWSTQYAIFDIDFNNFKSIDSILFYKQGFNWSTQKEEERGEDIFIRNLKIYVLQPISAINGNYRLEIQSPDGLIFETLDNTERLSIIGKITKSYYEDLSDNTTYYWFKKNPNVTQVTHNLYHQYGGIGWEYIGGPDKKGNTKNILLYGNENTAYKNKYKCVALVDETVLLKDEFIIYNNAVGVDLEIVSDLGQSFSFDAGTPLLTCKLKLKNSNSYEEYLENYKYIWSITIENETTSFAPGYLQSLESIIWDSNTGEYKKRSSTSSSIADIMREAVENNIINIVQGIHFYNGDELITSEQNLYKATRIKYPIENLAIESTATFNCHVWKIEEESEKDFGETSIILKNQGHPQISSYRLVLENGDQVFQYDEYGNPPNSPKLKSPQEIKPIIPHLLNPAGVEVANKNYRVQWTLPIEDTLIVPNATLQLNPSDGNKISLDTNLQCSFGIAQSYNEDNLNNQILCKVILNDEVIQAATDFYFGKVGSNGTNGTDVVAKIVSNVDKQILTSQPIILYRYNNGNNVISNTSISVANVNYLASSNSNHTKVFKAKLYQKNKEIPEDKYTIRWNIAGNPQSSQNNFSRYINVQNNFSSSNGWTSFLQWQKNKNNPGTDAEYLKWQPIYIIRAQITYEEKDYYAFYSFPVVEYNSTSIPTYNKIAINKSTLLKEIVYNADGRNPIYNHNQGVELINIPEGCTISWYAYGGKNGDEITADFKLILNRNDKIENAETHFENQTNNFIYILPNDEYNGSYTNNRVIAYISKNNQEIAVVTIPIYMSLNTFGLASLNAWDGNTVTIDDTGGYVMAPQIGAGEKDTNNRFTGILMGKTETYTGAAEGEKETGLFGYAHGVQSIFLNAQTGDAYFGLPDGQELIEQSGTLVPRTEGTSGYDNYNEGRVELRPGGISKVGGWRLGHQSLYYTSSGEIGNKYGTGVGPNSTTKQYDYIPMNDGKIQRDTNNPKRYSGHHIKDIKEEDSGILIHAGENPYISIKGRTLDPTGADAGLLDSGTESFLKKGDSLEIQLDPRTPTLFSIFRHNGQARYKKDSNNRDVLLYEKTSRTFLAGINGRGQLVANGLQSMTQNTNQGSNTDTVTTFGVDAVAAFGETIETATYVGLKMLAGADMVGKLFIKDRSANNTPLYLSGSGVPTNEYIRPLSLHGKTISMYASNSNSIATTTSSKITISNAQFYGGNPTAYISLNTTATTGNNIKVPGNLTIDTTTTTSGYGNINIYAGPSNRSYLTLNRAGNAILQGWSSLTEYAQNGSITLNAQSNGTTQSQLNLTNSSGSSSKLETAGQLNINTKANSLNLNAKTELIAKAESNIGIYGGNTSGTGSNCGIYLPTATTYTNAFFRAVRPLDITSTMGMNLSSGGAINMTASGNNAGLINISTTYNPNSGNAFNISTGLGGFAIQKSSWNNNYIYSSNLGIRARHGYFESTYGNNNSIYSYGRVMLGAYGAEGYAFTNEDSVSYGDYTVRGYNIESLLSGILKALSTEVSAINSTISTINTSISNLQTGLNNLDNNKANKSDLQTLANDFDGHKHRLNPTGSGNSLVSWTTPSTSRMTVVTGVSTNATGGVTNVSTATIEYVTDVSDHTSALSGFISDTPY